MLKFNFNAQNARKCSMDTSFRKQFRILENIILIKNGDVAVNQFGNKEIHFYADWISFMDHSGSCDLAHTWATTLKAIQILDPVIHTTQMGLLSTMLWEAGYRIFIHENDEMYEVKLGCENARTNRELRMGHNLFKMWMNGEFD